MSRIDELIEELCPEGVPYHSLPTLAKIDRGLTYQKSDEDPNGSIAVLRSNNIDQASNTVSLVDTKRLRSDLNANPKTRLVEGDILISAASGSRSHVGKVAYISKDPDAYFGGFMMAIRAGELIQGRYLFHILTSSSFREYLDQSLSSSTINNINSAVLEGFNLPVPPLGVQREIVSILDKFTQLEAELEAELEARRIQYEVTRDRLLDFSGDLSAHPMGDMIREFCPEGVLVRELSSCGAFKKGGSLQKKDMIEIGYPAIHYGQIHTNPAVFLLEPPTRVSDEVFSSSRVADPGDLIIADTSEDLDGVATAVAWLGDSKIAVSGHILIFSHDMEPKYVSYFFKTSEFKRQKNKKSKGVKVKDISSQRLGEVVIPVPPLEIQKEIVSILDKLDALVNDITIGLPAEIAARRKQYEYYRNKLLTFKELEAA